MRTIRPHSHTEDCDDMPGVCNKWPIDHMDVYIYPLDKMVCPLHIKLLANASLAYVIACIGYLAVTHNYGTPFGDSLTDAQLKARKKSMRDRRIAFLVSLFAGVCILLFWQPLRDM